MSVGLTESLHCDIEMSMLTALMMTTASSPKSLGSTGGPAITAVTGCGRLSDDAR